MTGKQRALIFILAGVGGLVAIGASVAMFFMAMKGAMPKQTTGDEKRLVVTAADLAQFGLEEADAEAEAFSSTRQFDGSRIVSYTYKPEEGPTLDSQTHVLPHSLGAMQMFKMVELGLKAEAKFDKSGRRLVDAPPSLLPAGDQRYAALVQVNGETMGNFFLVRQGRVVHTVHLIGIELETADEVSRLLTPALEESKRRFAKR